MVITEPDDTHIPATNPGATCCPLGSQKRPDLLICKLPPLLLPLTSPDAHQDFLGSVCPRASSAAHLWTLASPGVTGPVSPTWAHPAALQHPTPRDRAEAPLTGFPTRPARPTLAQDGVMASSLHSRLAAQRCGGPSALQQAPPPVAASGLPGEAWGAQPSPAAGLGRRGRWRGEPAGCGRSCGRRQRSAGAACMRLWTPVGLL